jgi:hypothetical protein
VPLAALLFDGFGAADSQQYALLQSDRGICTIMHNPVSLDVSVLDPVSGTRKALNRLCTGSTSSAHHHVGSMPFSPWNQSANVVFLHQYFLECDEYCIQEEG